MGEKAAVLDPEEWNGTWTGSEMSSGSISRIKVIDEKNGILQVAVIEDDKDKLELSVMKIHVRESGGWQFYTLDEEDEDDSKLYNWGRIEKDDKQIIVWQPDVSKFDDLVEQKILPGDIDEKGNVILGKLTTEHYKLITSGEKGVLLDWEEPFAYFRLFSE